LTKVHRFQKGKVPTEVLKRVVFNRLGAHCKRLLQGPHVGEDAAVIDNGDKVLVIASDPITGAIGNVGYLVVHINANDIASTGARPLWFLCVMLLPEGAGEDMLEEIMDQINLACCDLGISVVGGYTETTPGLNRPILVGIMIGETEKDGYVTTSGAEPGDKIVLTKGAGIEGTAVLAQDLAEVLYGQIEDKVIQSAKAMLKKISIVPEALKAVKIGGVHSLHDPTEGGILNGVWEMAEAAGVGVLIKEEAIHIAEETRKICEILRVDPLKLLGSGALLIIVKAEMAEKLVSSLKEMGVTASIIGEILSVDEGRTLIKNDGRITTIEAVEQDEVYRILEKFGYNIF